jgi:hypothetical protein
MTRLPNVRLSFIVWTIAITESQAPQFYSIPVLFLLFSLLDFVDFVTLTDTDDELRLPLSPFPVSFLLPLRGSGFGDPPVSPPPMLPESSPLPDFARLVDLDPSVRR